MSTDEAATKFLKELQGKGFKPVSVYHQSNRFDPQVTNWEDFKTEVPKRYEIEDEESSLIALMNLGTGKFFAGTKSSGAYVWSHDSKFAKTFMENDWQQWQTSLQFHNEVVVPIYSGGL